MIKPKLIKNLAFSILDQSKHRGFHLYHDLKFYSKTFNLPTNTLFDVGANVGQTTCEMRKYFPKSSIHCFEPINSTFDILRKNLGHDQETILNNVALGDKDGEALIYLREESLINSLLNVVSADEKQVPESQKITQRVEILSGDNYLKSINMDSLFFLKIDAEGFDLEVLKGFEETLLRKKINFILAETSFDKMDSSHGNFFLLNKHLNQFGYTVTGFYDLIYYRGFSPTLNYCNTLWSSISAS
jgi:FkbM family methyltransferase